MFKTIAIMHIISRYLKHELVQNDSLKYRIEVLLNKFTLMSVYYFSYYKKINSDDSTNASRNLVQMTIGTLRNLVEMII